MVGAHALPAWAVLVVEAIRIFKDGGFSKAAAVPSCPAACPPCSPQLECPAARLECPNSSIGFDSLLEGILGGGVVGGLLVLFGGRYGSGPTERTGRGTAPGRRGGGVVDSPTDR